MTLQGSPSAPSNVPLSCPTPKTLFAKVTFCSDSLPRVCTPMDSLSSAKLSPGLLTRIPLRVHGPLHLPKHSDASSLNRRGSTSLKFYLCVDAA